MDPLVFKHRAEAWWEDNNARSTEFVLLPEVAIPSGYNRNGAMGIGTAGGNNLGSGHGTSLHLLPLVRTLVWHSRQTSGTCLPFPIMSGWILRQHMI